MQLISHQAVQEKIGKVEEKDVAIVNVTKLLRNCPAIGGSENTQNENHEIVHCVRKQEKEYVEIECIVSNFLAGQYATFAVEADCEC